MLPNYLAGVAGEMVEQLVANGSDVCWRVSHHSILLAIVLHNIMLQDGYDPRPVAEVDVDQCLRECLKAAANNRAVKSLLLNYVCLYR